jgi:hypothetical protein
MDDDRLGNQGRTEKQEHSMHQTGAISGILFLIAIPLTFLLYLVSLAY